MEHPALQGAGILHAHHGDGQHRLEDARRREGIGGADLAPVVDHGIGALGAVDAEARQHRLRIGEDVIADPGDRQIGDDLVALVEPVEAAADLGRDQDVVMAEHHALRPPRRAGGVEDDAEIGALPGFHLALERGRGLRVLQRLGAGLDHRLDGVELAVIVVAQAPGLVIEHVPEMRQALSDRKQLVDLLLVLHDGEDDLRMVEDIGHLLRDAVGIDRDGNGAEPLGGAHRPVELRPVVADDRDLLAAPQPEILQSLGEIADMLRDFGPVPGLPDAEVLVTIGDARGALAGVAQQQFRKGVRLTGGADRHDCVLPVESPSIAATSVRAVAGLVLMQALQAARIFARRRLTDNSPFDHYCPAEVRPSMNRIDQTFGIPLFYRLSGGSIAKALPRARRRSAEKSPQPGSCGRRSIVAERSVAVMAAIAMRGRGGGHSRGRGGSGPAAAGAPCCAGSPTSGARACGGHIPPAGGRASAPRE